MKANLWNAIRGTWEMKEIDFGTRAVLVLTLILAWSHIKDEVQKSFDQINGVVVKNKLHLRLVKE